MGIKGGGRRKAVKNCQVQAGGGGGGGAWELVLVRKPTAFSMIINLGDPTAKDFPLQGRSCSWSDM